MGVAGHEDGDATLYSQVHSKYGNSTLWVQGNYRILAEYHQYILPLLAQSWVPLGSSQLVITENMMKKCLSFLLTYHTST